MAANGFTADTGLLTNLAKALDDFAKTTTTTLATYNLSVPDFGQTSAIDFPAAHELAGQYAARAKDHTDSQTAFLTWVQTMSNVASILSKRYATVEDLGKASADDIKNALDEATVTANPTGYPPTM